MQTIVERALEPKATCGGFPYRYLPKAIRERWLEAIRDWQFPSGNLTEWKSFNIQAGSSASTFLTPEILQLLDNFSRPNGPDAFVIDGLPLDPALEPTPQDGKRPPEKSAISESVMAGIIKQMGHQILSYKQEKQGAAFHELVPIAGHEMIQSNAGRVKFGFHTDNSHLPARFRQEGIALFGLRNETDVATLLITLDDIKAVISPELLLKLRYPIYRISAPLSFDLAGWSVLTEPRPIIWTDDNGIDRIALPRSNFKQANAEADAAMKKFRKLLDNMKPRHVVLGPGRFLAFRDNRALHGRDTVIGDRWVQRVYFSKSLALHRAATNSDSREFAFDIRLLMMA
jgi:L-asparagine oxygenase